MVTLIISVIVIMIAMICLAQSGGTSSREQYGISFVFEVFTRLAETRLAQMCIYIYIYAYISLSLSLSLSIYIYIYRERER